MNSVYKKPRRVKVLVYIILRVILQWEASHDISAVTYELKKQRRQTKYYENASMKTVWPLKNVYKKPQRVKVLADTILRVILQWETIHDISAVTYALKKQRRHGKYYYSSVESNKKHLNIYNLEKHKAKCYHAYVENWQKTSTFQIA